MLPFIYQSNITIIRDHSSKQIMLSTQMLKAQRKQLPSYLVPLHQFLQNQRPSIASIEEQATIQDQLTQDQASKQDSSLNIKNINFKFFLPITKIQFEVYFSSLQSLSINHCDIRSLQNFPWLKRLTYLNVGFNHIQGGFNYLIPCKKLKHLNIESNLVFEWEKLKPIRKIRSEGAVQVCIKNNPFCTNEKQTITSLSRNLKQYNIKVMKDSKDASEWSASNSKSKSKKKSKSNQTQKKRSKQKKPRKLQRLHGGMNNLQFIQSSSSEIIDQDQEQEEHQIQKIQSCLNTSQQNNMGLRITFSGMQGQRSSTIHNGRQASDQIQENNQFNSFFTGRTHSNNHRNIAHGTANMSRVIRFNNQGQDDPMHEMIRRRRIHPLNSSSNNQSTAIRRAELIRQIERERQIFNMARVDQDSNIESHLDALNGRYRRRNTQLRMDSFMRHLSEQRNQRNQRNQVDNTDLLSRPSLRINVSRTTGSDGNNFFSRIPFSRGRAQTDLRALQDPMSSSQIAEDNIIPSSTVNRVNLNSLQSSQSSHQQRNIIRPISSDQSESQEVLDILMNQEIKDEQELMRLRVDLSQQGGNINDDNDDDQQEDDDGNGQENQLQIQGQQEQEDDDNQEEEQQQQQNQA